jgi:hypothetical protein
MGVMKRGCSLYAKIVSTPSLAFSPRFVEAEERARVQAFRSELAVQAFGEGVVRRLARAREIQRDGMHEGPQIKLFADEFGSVVEPDGLRTADFSDNPFQRINDIAARKCCRTSIAGDSRVNVSTMVRTRILRPSNS